MDKSIHKKEIRCKILDMEYFQQEDSNWCWAASSQMILKYHGLLDSNFSQIRFVKKIKGIKCCIREKNCLLDKRDCDVLGYPYFPPERLTFERKIPSTPLSWNELKKQIESKLPMVFEFEKNGKSIGHFMVIIGYCEGYSHVTIDSDSILIVYDPLGNIENQANYLKYIPYKQYAGRSSLGKHGQTYFNIMPLDTTELIFHTWKNMNIINQNATPINKVQSYVKNHH